MPKDEASHRDRPMALCELRALGWPERAVLRYGQLLEYRRRWGAINLEREERQFLSQAESALSQHLSSKTPLPQPTIDLRRNRSTLPRHGGLETDCFVALDFETADQGRDSACSIAIVRVEENAIVHREHRLIRPPRQRFLFTSIHGISWPHVADAPSFAELWPELEPCLDGARFIAAHNSSFDSGVMQACCEQAGVSPPAQPYFCTVQLARKTWNIRPTKFPDVCRHLNLSLNHHDALSDAEACANIVLAAIRDGGM
jgi:DNA polymerase-3 subunit epsilon